MSAVIFFLVSAYPYLTDVDGSPQHHFLRTL
ncbi:Hypothetical protein Cp3995_0572 [Corynebacterium pseudotuberculosis 3/99-5]|nr:Hypothetical protein Cp3995_0572 [Corynebacterium pseudotuberculosis 3/99-5]